MTKTSDSKGAAGSERPGPGVPEGASRALIPQLGPFDVTMIVMGSIVGSGIFFSPAGVAAAAGSLGGILGLWALGGLFALTGAIVFAELGAMLPRAGGQYVFLREAFGRFVAFLFGWVLLTVILSPALAFVAGVFTQHVEQFAVALGWCEGFGAWGRSACSVGLIAAMTLLNIRGLRLGATVQNLAMLAKLGGILFIVALGLGVALGWLETPPHASAAPPGSGPPDAEGGPRTTLGGLATALIGIVFSYGGWQNVTAVAAEVKRPERTLPLGILTGTVGVVLLYMSLNAALVALLGVEGLAATQTPVASAALAVSQAGGLAVTGMIALSAFAIVQALLMVTPRIFYAMAADGVFFRAATAVHPRWSTPWVAIAILGGAATAHVFLVGELGDLLAITAQGDAFFFCLCGIALFRLRRTQPELPRPYRAHGYPLLPAIFLIFSGAMVVNVAVSCSAVVVGVVAGLFALGTLLYLCWRR